MSARRFTATCPHGGHADRATFERHWKAEHKPRAYGSVCKPLTGRPFRQPRGWRPPTAKAFDPQLGAVGSWVSFTDWSGRPVTGQVWATISGGMRARVWVADGTTYHDVAVSALRPAVVTEQPALAA